MLKAPGWGVGMGTESGAAMGERGVKMVEVDLVGVGMGQGMDSWEGTDLGWSMVGMRVCFRFLRGWD